MHALDDPGRIVTISERIRNKQALNHFYRSIYKRYETILTKCPDEGLVVELGSGGGFAREFIPDLILSDVNEYPGTDCVVNGEKLPFADQSVKMFCMLNVFHHIPDVESFLNEANRCLVQNGRILIVDQHRGWISRFVLQYLHHEGYDENTTTWKFKSSGPLSSANGALTWIVFDRDREMVKKLFPDLHIVKYEPHTPLLYWLSGGLKHWTLVPRILVPFIEIVDSLLIAASDNFGSFVDVELVKKAQYE